jgi:uncharacterized membrane protein YphA (DoxX/SURF4 family)
MLNPRHGLALLRIGVGLYFISQVGGKTPNFLLSGASLSRQLQNGLPRMEPFYQHFLQGVVLPHVDLFARLVFFAEWLVGVALTLGLFTPVAAVVGAWLNVNYMLMKGLPSAGGSVDRLFVLADIVFIAAGAGLTLGLDARLLKRLRQPRRG